MSDMAANGVYNNPRFMHACTTVVGYTVQIHTRDGSVWEGVLHTFSPQFTICLLYAIKVEPKQNGKLEFGKNIGFLYAALKSGSSVQKQLFIDLKDIVRITALNVDLNLANKDTGKLETDAEISGFDTNKLGANDEPRLESWRDEDADEIANKQKGKIATLEQNQNGGWNADDMFNYNEKRYGVKTTWDETHYTSAVPQHNTQEWREKTVKAAAIAKEIESSTKSKERYTKEDGDEEEKYSAVLRPMPVSRQITRGGKPRPFTDRRSNRARRDETDTLRDFGKNLTLVDGPSKLPPNDPAKNSRNSTLADEPPKQPQNDPVKNSKNSNLVDEPPKQPQNDLAENSSNSNVVDEPPKQPQNDLAKNSKLNPHAKEFVYRPQNHTANQTLPPQQSISDPYNHRIPMVPGTTPHHPQFVPNHPQTHFPVHYMPHFSTPQAARYVRNGFQPIDYNNMRPEYPASPYPPMGAYPSPHPQQQLIYPPQPHIYHVVQSPMHVVPNPPYDGSTPVYMAPNYVVNNS